MHEAAQFQFFEVHDSGKLIHPSHHGKTVIQLIPEMHRLCIRTSRSVNLLALNSHPKRTLRLERNKKEMHRSSAAAVAEVWAAMKRVRKSYAIVKRWNGNA